MIPKFAQRVNNLEPAAVYEILKQTSSGKVIPFSAGNPGFEAIPVELISQMVQEILQESPAAALQYGMSKGYKPLRESLGAFLSNNFNIGGADDLVIITSGATQAIELCAKVFCNEGDTVITENPSFVGTLATFNSYGLNIVGVDMNHDGMDLDKLDETLTNNKDVRFIYTIPNFQNPTGWTMPLENRKRLYEMAVRHNVLILEDDAYRDLRYSGEDIPTLKSMDTYGIVLYCGSFSKVVSPGLRVGYLVANKDFMDKLAAAKQVSDVHTPVLNQIIIHKIMKEHDFEGHIAKICDIYRNKLQITLDCLDKHMGDNISYVKPEGGLYVFCKLPDNVDAMEFFNEGIKAGVAVVYGSAFYVDPNAKSPYFRINFSAASEEQLKEGIAILGEVLKKLL